MEFSHPGLHGQCTALSWHCCGYPYLARRGDVKEERRSRGKTTMGAGKGEKHPGRGRPYPLQYQARDAPLPDKQKPDTAVRVRDPSNGAEYTSSNKKNRERNVVIARVPELHA